MARKIKYHKNCGGFIMPDLNNSLEVLPYGRCAKCGADHLIEDYLDTIIKETDVYVIHNINTGKYLVWKIGETSYIVAFESMVQAEDFAVQHELSNYAIIIPNVNAMLTNGNDISILEKEE